MIAAALFASNGCGIVEIEHAGDGKANVDAAKGPPRAKVLVPDLRYRRGRLFATIVVEPASNAPVQAKLTGPGAPDTPISFEGSCHSLVWKDGVGYNTKELSLEQRICAAIDRPETAELVLELDVMRRDLTSGVAAGTYTSVGSISTGGGGSVDVSVKSGGGSLAEGPPRWDTGTTAGTMNSLKTRNNAKDKQYAALLRQLDAQSARYRPGCMGTLLEDSTGRRLPPATTNRVGRAPSRQPLAEGR